MGLADIHCHILPGIDDGPGDPDDALSLVLGLESIGFTDFFPTPHQKSGSWTPTVQERESARESLETLLAQHGSRVCIHPSAGENMWDELFLDRVDTWQDVPMYPGRKAFLVEFLPQAVPPMLRQRFFEFRVAGYLPVIAHVERYHHISKNKDRLCEIGQSAALLVNLSSLGGMAGWSIKRLSRKLVEAGLVHAAATDLHGERDLEFCRLGAKWIQDTLGEDAFHLLLSENPRRILAGEIPDW